MFTCKTHSEDFRTQRLLENHYIRFHLLDFATVEAYIQKRVRINIVRPVAAAK
jgi:hypothetical protein